MVCKSYRRDLLSKSRRESAFIQEKSVLFLIATAQSGRFFIVTIRNRPLNKTAVSSCRVLQNLHIIAHMVGTRYIASAQVVE